LLNLFGDIIIGDEGQNGLKTGLCIIAKRLDTNSTWPVTNHPDDIYFQRNKFLLRDLTRASTAGLTYFSPEIIDLGQNEIGTFVDGGLSMMNNPALQLYFIATLKGYPFGWKTGADALKIVSVGTGRRNPQRAVSSTLNPNVIEYALLAPEQLLHDAAELVEIMMQYFSDSPTARVINKKFGNLEGEEAGNEASFSYFRYNIDLHPETLDALGFENLTDTEIDSLMRLDQTENRHMLHTIGQQSATTLIEESHSSKAFDVLKIA
jgi:patatin-like phospholipase/acyl hydrolase